MNIDLSKVPNKPGCYLWKDVDGNIIYVGKAKNLKNRMKQYFLTDINQKTKLLVKNIASFDYVISENELSSLITELNLINKYNPKFNIKLKQTKTYPYIKLTKSPLKIEVKRIFKNEKNSKYYGPFPEGFGATKIKKLLESIFPIGKCLDSKTGKQCLNYKLGLCPGYCFKKKSEINEKKIFNDVEQFLKGNVNYVLKIVVEKIEMYSDKQMYEQAQKLSLILPIIKKYREKQKSLFRDGKDRDIFGFYFEKNVLSIAISYVRYGKLLLTTKELYAIHDLDYNDAIIHFIEWYYKENYLPKEIITSLSREIFSSTISNFIVNPKQGIKYDLLNSAINQAKFKYDEEKETFELKIKKKEEAIKILKTSLNINNFNRVELVDISNHGGKDQVGVVVSFRDFEPDKSSYRKYNLDNEINDYEKIYEVTYRHFRRKLLEKAELPNLYIVDGKHQLKYAHKALKELKLDNIKTIGLVKDKNHNTNYFVTLSGEEKKLFDKSNLYVLLGNMQDEVHRFAINFYRKKNLNNILK